MWQYNNGKLWLPSGNQSWLAGKSLFLDDFRGEKHPYIYIDDFTQFSCDFPVFFPLKPPFTSHVPASHMGLSENRVPLNPFTTIFPIKQLFLMGIPTFRQTMVDIGGLPHEPQLPRPRNPPHGYHRRGSCPGSQPGTGHLFQNAVFFFVAKLNYKIWNVTGIWMEK